MALYLMLLSALFASLQNLCMRRSVDTGSSTNLYVPVQLLISCAIAVLLGPVRNNNYVFDGPTVLVGLFVGVIFGLFMWGLGQSLKYGSSGLTFAVVNSSSILPAVFMTLLFGGAFNHPYHWYTGLGSLMVVSGIFWSSWTSISCSNKARWALYIGLTIVGFVLFATSLQWRVLLENHGGESRLLPFKLDGAKAEWFMPAIFFSAMLFQIPALLKNKNAISKDTLFYGLLGGVSNGSSMFFSILATVSAAAWQNALLFPLFSIGVIELSNLWGKYLYKEQLDFAPRAFCILGLVLGSVQWPLLFGG